MKHSYTLLFSLTLFVSSLHAQKLKVVSTASMINDMAENIGGNLFEYETIVPIGGDPHIYEPTPEDAKKVEKANLIFMNGLTFEGWIIELIENSGTEAETIVVTDGIKAIESAQYSNATDPHVWMDPVLGLGYLENIKDALIALRPEVSEEITFNYNLYKKQIEELHEYCKKRIAEIPESRRILITSHDAFQYFGRRYGLQLEAVLGTSTDADVQTSDIQRIEKILQSTPVSAVFIESTINPKLIKQLASDNGVIVGGKLYADSLGDKDGPAGSYEKMIRHNIKTIVDALKSERIETAESGGVSNTSMWAFGAVLVILIFVIFFLLRKN